jgi:hypothetical protein
LRHRGTVSHGGRLADEKILGVNQALQLLNELICRGTLGIERSVVGGHHAILCVEDGLDDLESIVDEG